MSEEKYQESGIVAIRKEINEQWLGALKETFIKEIGKAKGDLSSLIAIGSKLGNLTADTRWKENIWKDGGNSWRDAWHDDNAITGRGAVIRDPEVFLAQIRSTIQDLAKK